MQVRCPSCGASNSLDSLVEHEAASRTLARVLEANPVGAHLVRYLALHRPGKSSLRFGRVEALLSELLPDIERGAIHRKGRDWPAPPELWRSAIEVLLAKRDARTLTLPLSSHGLLYEVLAGLSDKLEGLQERATEADRRQRGAVASTTVSANTPPLYKPEPGSAAKPTPEQLERLRAAAQRPPISTTTEE